MRPIPILPFLGGISSLVAAAEAAFNAAISRQPPPPPPTDRGARPLSGPAQVAFVPVFVPPPRINTEDGTQVQLASYRQPMGPTDPLAPPLGEQIRRQLFEEGKGIDVIGRERGMNEQQILDSVDGAQGVHVDKASSSTGDQYTITDAKSGKTITITHDHEKGVDNTSVTDRSGRRESWTVDGNHVTTHSVYDPKTGVLTIHSEDPRTGAVTDTTVAKDGSSHSVTTDANGKKTIEDTKDGYTIIQHPDGKVSIRDERTGTEIMLEKMSEAEALRRDGKLANDIDAAEKDRKSLEQRLIALGLTPEMLASPDPSKFTPEQAKLYKNYVGTQWNILKLKGERLVLLRQFELSLTKPGTTEYHTAMVNLLDAAHGLERIDASAKADQNLADKAINLAEANRNLARYNSFGPAVEVFRAEHPDYFNPDGYISMDRHWSGKLVAQEVVYKNGHLYLRNTYETDPLIGGPEREVREFQMTFDPGDQPYNRSDAGRQLDQRWQTERNTFSNECLASDVGWSDAQTRQKKAAADYQSAERDVARNEKIDVDAAIPDLRKAYDDAVKKHGPGTTEKPTTPAKKGEEPVQIQIDGETRWVHPEVAAAYVALVMAEEEASTLDEQIAQSYRRSNLLNLQLAEPPKLLNYVGSKDYENELWSRHADFLIADDQNVNAAEAAHGRKQSDRIQTQIGLQNANIEAWRRDHPELAARLDALEHPAPSGSTVPASASSNVPIPDDVVIAPAGTKWPVGTMLTRPAHLTNFIGPLSYDQLVPVSATDLAINQILASPEAKPLVAARSALADLNAEATENKKFQRDVGVEGEWLKTLLSMPADERRDAGKRDDKNVEFVSNHADAYADPALKLQQDLGGPHTGRDARNVRTMAEKMAHEMEAAGIDIDIDHVVNQVLHSPQINGDNRGGDLTIRPIAMVYKESGSSMTTGIFEVTNKQGQVFLVDLKGRIWGSREEFRENNNLYNDHGILLMPKNLDTSGAEDGSIRYESQDARHVSAWEKYADPIIGIGTGIATVGSFIPGVNIVAAPAAIAGGTYLGAKAAVNQFQYLKTGGSWGDGESWSNMLGIVGSTLPLASGGLRLVGLTKGIGFSGAFRIATGSASRSAEYLGKAQTLMQASVFGRQGTALMRTARGLDGASILVGLPQMGLSTLDMARLGEMSGLERANALVNFFSGWYATGRGVHGLVMSAPRKGTTLPTDAGLPSDPQGGSGGKRRPQSLSSAYHPEGTPLPKLESRIPPALRAPDPTAPLDPLQIDRPGDPSLFQRPSGLDGFNGRNVDASALVASLIEAGISAEAARMVAAQVANQDGFGPSTIQYRTRGEIEGRSPEIASEPRGDEAATLPAMLRLTSPADEGMVAGHRPDERMPVAEQKHVDGGDEGPAPSDPDGPLDPRLGERAPGDRVSRPLTDAEIADNRVEASAILEHLTLGLSTLNGVEALRLPQLADQASRSPIMMELLRLADRQNVRLIDGTSNPLQVVPRAHQLNSIGHRPMLDLIALQSGDARERAVRAGSGEDGYVAELTGDLAHELYHMWSKRQQRYLEAPPGMHGKDAYVAAYMNLHLAEEGGARLLEFAVADELARNGGIVAPSLGEGFNGGFGTLFARFKTGAVDWAGASEQAGALTAIIPGLPYVTDFAQRAEANWNSNERLRQQFESMPLDEKAEPRSLSAAYHPAGEPIPQSQQQVPPAFRKPELPSMSELLPPYRPGDPFPRASALGMSDAGLIRQLDPDAVQAHLVAAGIRPETAAEFAQHLRDQGAAGTRASAVPLPADVTHTTQPSLKVTGGTSGPNKPSAQPAKPVHFPSLSDAEFAKLTRSDFRKIDPDAFKKISAEQVAAMTDRQWRGVTEEQIRAIPAEHIPFIPVERIRNLRVWQVAAFTDRQIAALTLDQVRKLSREQLARLSTEQLGAFTAEQAAVITDRQRGGLSPAQLAALEAPRITGARKAWKGLITEIRENGWSYLVMGGSSLVSGYLLTKFGWMPWASNGAYILRGTGFALQAAFPKTFGPDTRWAQPFAAFYAATFVPNVASGTVLMFNTTSPLVDIPFGIGTLPFAAQQTYFGITGRRPNSPWGNHIGYAGYTMGSAFFIPPAFGDPFYGVNPASAIMFQAGSELWFSTWTGSRKANRTVPGTARTGLERTLDRRALKADDWASARKWPGIADRVALGGMYGGGLILFGAMGLIKLLSDDKKNANPTPGDTRPPGTPPMIPPEDPPRVPQPQPQPPQPIFVSVGEWHANHKPADSSTVWDVAGNNLAILLTPQQWAEADRRGLSETRNRDTLIANYGIPRLIELNPRYPLAENPDLIQPRWELKVGERRSPAGQLVS